LYIQGNKNTSPHHIADATGLIYSYMYHHVLPLMQYIRFCLIVKSRIIWMRIWMQLSNIV